MFESLPSPLLTTVTLDIRWNRTFLSAGFIRYDQSDETIDRRSLAEHAMLSIPTLHCICLDGRARKLYEVQDTHGGGERRLIEIPWDWEIAYGFTEDGKQLLHQG